MEPLLEKVLIISPDQQKQPVADGESESVLFITPVSCAEMVQSRAQIVPLSLNCSDSTV